MRELERGHDRMHGRLERVEEEMRQFRPIPLESAKDRGVVERLSDDVHNAHDMVRKLSDRFDEYVKEQARIREVREEKEREREKDEQRDRELREATERRDRWARWIGAGALTLTFISMTVGWLILAL